MGPSPVRLAVESVATRLEVSLDRLHRPPRVTPIGLDAFVERVATVTARPAGAVLRERALEEIERHVREEARRRTAGDPDHVHDGDLTFARTCYLLCRLVRPVQIVETGVGNGVSTSFLLQALEENGDGSLVSIDLPQHGVSESTVGRFVPEELRSRWEVRFGATKRLLPPILAELGTVGMFVHDSRHTYRNVSRELRTVTSRLLRPASVVVDDAERHSAFSEWVEEAQPAVSGFLEPSTKAGLIGAAILTS